MVELNRTVEKLTAETGEAAIQKLQDEIKDCKGILKCGVCFDRPKEVLSLTNMHLCFVSCLIFFHEKLVYEVLFLILAGCDSEMLPSILQPMHPEKFRNQAPQVPRLWNSVWAERCSIRKDIDIVIK